MGAKYSTNGQFAELERKQRTGARPALVVSYRFVDPSSKKAPDDIPVKEISTLLEDKRA